MDDSNPSELFGPAMVLVWGVLAAAILLFVLWRVHKHRSRRRRREAARESKRLVHAWREGGTSPNSSKAEHHDAPPADSVPH